jgi:gamma-glutamylputrescine oxidase
MEPLWGRPPWRRVEFRAPRIEPSEAEVAIIGGGLTGVSAAYHLARRGVSTVVLEGGRIGDGASGRSGGIVLEGTAKGILDGIDNCLATLERVVRAEEIECELSLAGAWELDHRGQSEKEPLAWSDEDSRMRIAGTVAGGTVDPAALLGGLARAAANAGAVLRERTPVRRIRPGSRPVVELAGAELRPRFVVVAVNAWIESLVANVRPVTAALTFASVTEPLDASVLREIGLGVGIPFYTIDLPYLWGRELSDGSVVFGAGLVFGTPAQLRRLDIGKGESKTVLDRLEARVCRLHPALEGARFSTRWAGPIGISRDFAPILGAMPGAPEVFVAGGFTGHGIALGVWAGQALARAIVEREPLPPCGAVARQAVGPAM